MEPALEGLPVEGTKDRDELLVMGCCEVSTECHHSILLPTFPLTLPAIALRWRTRCVHQSRCCCCCSSPALGSRGSSPPVGV